MLFRVLPVRPTQIQITKDGRRRMASSLILV